MAKRQSYEVLHRVDGSPQQVIVQGIPIVLFAAPGWSKEFTFMGYCDKKKEIWSVVECRTGLAIGKGLTLREAKENASDAMLLKERDEFYERVKTAIEHFGERTQSENI